MIFIFEIRLRVSNIIKCLDFFFIFFFNDTATTEIYTLSLHDALPISAELSPCGSAGSRRRSRGRRTRGDRKSIRLNSSHVEISYAVFCLKKKKKKKHVVSLITKKTKKTKKKKQLTRK